MKRGWIVFIGALFALWLPVSVTADSIPWLSYKDGMAKGKSENRKIFVNFHADW